MLFFLEVFGRDTQATCVLATSYKNKHSILKLTINCSKVILLILIKELQKTNKPLTDPPNINIFLNYSTIIKTKKLMLVSYYKLNYKLYSDFTSFSANKFLLFQDPTIPQSFLVFHDLDIF